MLRVRGQPGGTLPLAQPSLREQLGREEVCLPGPCLGVCSPLRQPESSPLVEEPAWWWQDGGYGMGFWGPGAGGGFLLWPREEFLQAAVGERLPWNLGV